MDSFSPHAEPPAPQQGHALPPSPPLSSSGRHLQDPNLQTHLTMHPVSSSYTNSITWESSTAKEKKAYHATVQSLEHTCHNTPLRSMTFNYYLELREHRMKTERNAEMRKIMQKEEQQRLRAMGIPPLIEPFSGTQFKCNRIAVLAEQSIWCAWDTDQKPEIANWPAQDELKHEGDERAQSKYGRFLPLPRSKPNPTLAWSQCRQILIYPFDEVGKVPTLEDILLPVDEIPEEHVPMLLNQELCNHLDLFEDCDESVELFKQREAQRKASFLVSFLEGNHDLCDCHKL